ncbi:hypothetical protein DVH24_037040 [Malus domestica]|uniref:Uncharacterized protein n=1 Tax=Malus domestica TaxID=3750 RepID=A0A498HCR9_MALDO|nr:hypothetical protein DVH24_037040 [Malus domestica]
MNHQAANLPANSSLPGVRKGRHSCLPKKIVTSTNEVQKRHHSAAKAGHKIISAFMILLAGLLKLKIDAGITPLPVRDKDTVLSFIVAATIYYASLAVKNEDDGDPDLAKFLQMISLLSGPLALILEMVIIFPAFGCFGVMVWIICFVITVAKSYQLIAAVVKGLYRSAVTELDLVFDKLKKLFSGTKINGLALSNTMNMMNQAAGAGNLPVTLSSTTPSSSSHHATSEAQEHYRQSYSKELHECIISAITTLAVLLQRRHGAGATVSLFSTEYVKVVAFIVAFLVYIGSLAVKILQARENPDLSEFMYKISLSFGTLAVTLELLIMVPALGWQHGAFAFNKFYHETVVVLKRLYQQALEQILRMFDKLKELFMNIGASAVVVVSLSNAFNRLKELFVIRNVPPVGQGIRSAERACLISYDFYCIHLLFDLLFIFFIFLENLGGTREFY